LHDDVTQRLALLAIDAGRAERTPANAGSGEVMRKVRQGLVQLSEDVHALSYRLHPSILEDLGLVEALKNECEQFSQFVSIPVEVNAQGLPEMFPDNVTLGLFRVTQEALHNIGRHAGASQVEVSLRHLDAGLQLSVQDDGTGFDPARYRRGSSLGLAGMRQRISLLDGRLDIRSAPGHGTTVIAWVPLGEEHDETSARAAG
jgi:signal transduction histidine kinase